jgi:hypothetical protein
MAGKQRNLRLDDVITEAGVSYAGLARRVNQLGAAHGLDLRYDKTSVSRWVAGQQPRGVVPRLLAEALTDKLGRTVRVGDLGLADPDRPPFDTGLGFARSAAASVEQATALWRCEEAGHEFLLQAPFSAAAMVEPSRDWLVTPVDPRVDANGGGRVELSDVAAVRETTRMFDQLDHQFGGGHARSAVLQYLNSDVARLLRGSYRDVVGRALFGAVAVLTELAGWMAHDVGRHGVAQRYFIQALRLSQAAGDRACGAYVLTSMSNQALHLGHGHDAVQLARAAQQGAAGAATPAVRAECHALEARGHALLGDARACRAALTAAEAEFTRADPAAEPDWIRGFDLAVLQTHFGACFRDLGQAAEAERCTRSALTAHDAAQVRRRAYGTVQLAAIHLLRRDAAEACALGLDALALTGRLRSRRSREHLRDLQRRLLPYARERMVREFNEQVELTLRLTA